MDYIGRLTQNLNFGNVYDILKNKEISLNETHVSRIEKAESLFQKIAGGLESMIGGNMPDFSVEDIKEVVKTMGGVWENAEIEDARRGINQFKKYITHLEELKSNPQSFYRGKDYESLLMVCKKIKDLYAENHEVIRCSQDELLA